MSEVDVIYSCKECGWSYSLQNNKACPMCKTPPDVDNKLITDTLQEYSRRKGVFIKKKEAKLITTNFRKKYGRLPTFKEIWDIAEKIIAQKATGKKLVIKPDKVDQAISKKMAEMKKAAESKKERKKQIEAKRKGIEKVEEQPAAAPPSAPSAPSPSCPECGHDNPEDSNFCLECGSKLG